MGQLSLKAPLISAAAVAAPDKHALGSLADVIRSMQFNRTDADSLRGATTLVVHSLVLLGVAWLVGTHFVGSPLLVQQENVQKAEMGNSAQKMAEELYAQRANAEPIPVAQDMSLIAAAPESLPAPMRAKSKIDAPIAMPSIKVEHAPKKSAEKHSKARERLDRIGREIAAHLASTVSVVDHSAFKR